MVDSAFISTTRDLEVAQAYARDGGIIMELHQVMELKLANDADLRKFQEFFEYVFERQGFRFFYLHHNGGFPSLPQTLAQQKAPKYKRVFGRYTVLRKMHDLGATRNRCCFEIGLIKPGLLEKMLSSTTSQV